MQAEIDALMAKVGMSLDQVKAASELRWYRRGLTDSDCKVIAHLAGSGSLPQLRNLWLSNNQIGDGGMQAFASAVASGSLAHLEVRSLATALLPCPEPWHAHSLGSEVLFDVRYTPMRRY